jgi:RNA polymerase sigma-70 factor (ECF subfamily)
MNTRSNEEWLHDLRQPEVERTRTVSELREYLLRAVYLYLRDQRTELSDYPRTRLRQMAEDFAQEALVSVLENLDNFRGDSKFTTWAYRFVINKAADDLRRRRYRDISLDRLPEQEAAALMAVIEAGPRLDPDQAAERRELIEYLLTAIQTELNERQRLAILGVHFQGRSIQEIAALLEVSPNTLYKIIHDARKKLKLKLQARQLGIGDVLALFEGYS